MQYELHITDINQYKQCRRAWEYSSQLKQGLAPLKIYSPFFIGTVVHYGLELRYREGLTPSQAIQRFETIHLKELKNSPLWTSQEPTVRADLGLARELLGHYDLWQKYERGPLADKEFDFIAPEQDFKVLLRKTSDRRFWLAGRFDGIVRHKISGELYLWEIKTCRSISERVAQLDFDPQTRAYLWAAQQIAGAPLAGIVYTLLRKAAPKPPEILKNGMLSKAVVSGKTANTTAMAYEEYAKAYHREMGVAETGLQAFVKTNYQEPVQKLLEAGNQFQHRQIVNVSQSELTSFIQDLRLVGAEMVSKRTPLYPSPGYHCNYCRFKGPCVLRNRGEYDAEQRLLLEQFQPNPRFSGLGED